METVKILHTEKHGSSLKGSLSSQKWFLCGITVKTSFIFKSAGPKLSYQWQSKLCVEEESCH